jgi:hypothetical protein
MGKPTRDGLHPRLDLEIHVAGQVPLEPAPSGAESSGPRRLLLSRGNACEKTPGAPPGATSGLYDHSERDTRHDVAPLGLNSKPLRILLPTAPKRRHGPQDTARFAGSTRQSRHLSVLFTTSRHRFWIAVFPSPEPRIPNPAFSRQDLKIHVAGHVPLSHGKAGKIDRYSPTPVRRTACGPPPPSLSLILRLAVRLPVRVGIKLTTMEHVCPGRR